MGFVYDDWKIFIFTDKKIWIFVQYKTVEEKVHSDGDIVLGNSRTRRVVLEVVQRVNVVLHIKVVSDIVTYAKD